MELLRLDTKAIEIVKKDNDQNKIIGAISVVQ